MTSGFAYRGPYQHLSEEEIIARLDAHQGIIAVDTETVNTNDYTCIGIGIYINDNEGFYFRAFPVMSEYLPRIMGMLGDRDITKIYHNGMGFDLSVLDRLAEYECLTPPDDVNYQDSELMAKVAGLPGGLQRIGEEWLGATDLFSIQDLFAEFNTNSMLDVPWSRIAEKCLNDCRTTWQLYHYMEKKLSARQRECYEVDRRLVSILRRIERRGLGLRQAVLRDYESKLTRSTTRIVRECDAEASFHPGSNLQVGYVLSARGNILPFTKSRKQLQVTEELLEEIDDPLAAKIIEYRKAVKLLSSYIRPWIGKDRAYTHFRQDLATGRLASGKINSWDSVNRNLQNVPPDVREIFAPDKGVWTWADHSQIELRVLAWVTKDKTMMEEYKKPEPDLHRATMLAAQRFVPGFTRANGKTFNFARVFGAGDRKLSKATGIPLDKVPLVRAAMSDVYPESEAWIRRQMFEHNGEWVEDDFGRRMRLPEMVEGYNYNLRAFAAHVGKCAVNYPIQGTAATIVKKGLLMIDEAGVDLRCQIHDEYLIDGHWEPMRELAYIHPELYTPFETNEGVCWK